MNNKINTILDNRRLLLEEQLTDIQARRFAKLLVFDFSRHQLAHNENVSVRAVSNTLTELVRKISASTPNQ